MEMGRYWSRLQALVVGKYDVDFEKCVCDVNMSSILCESLLIIDVVILNCHFPPVLYYVFIRFCLFSLAANEEYYQLLMTNDSQPSGLDVSSYTIEEIDSITSEYTLKNNVRLNGL